jgi:ABC-type nitrate/sulfonate/bicarbonate transport system ATPase subunit
MVLSFCPRLMLLDEPFAGVDLDLRLDLWDLLHEYEERRRYKPTVVIVTHSLEEAAVLCDSVIFLRHDSGGTRVHGRAKPRNQFSGGWSGKPSAIYRDRSALGSYLSYLDGEFTKAIS